MTSGLSLDDWLKSFGFERHPFEVTEAGGAASYVTDFLNETFVKPENFDRILGDASYPKSTLVFAGRGCGKSTTRAMLSYYCAQNIPAGEQARAVQATPRILPVLHTQFSNLLRFTDDPVALVNAHINEILQRAVAALLRMLSDHFESITELAQQMSPLRRLELQSIVFDALGYVPFQDYYIAREILGKELLRAKETDTPDDRLSDNGNTQGAGIPLAPREIAVWLAARVQAGPIERLTRFVDLVTDLGIEAVYVLIDGLDELWMTADDPHVMAALIAPLLSDLPLMNTIPHLAFKVFAPDVLEAYLVEATRKVRRDRLAFEKIEWQEAQLVELLQRRLSFYSSDVVSTLDPVCEKSLIGKIDIELVRRSGRNPRYLILLGDYTFRSRCKQTVTQDDETFRLTEKDLADAFEQLSKEFPDLYALMLSNAIREPSKHNYGYTASGHFAEAVVKLLVDQLSRVVQDSSDNAGSKLNACVRAQLTRYSKGPGRKYSEELELLLSKFDGDGAHSSTHDPCLHSQGIPQGLFAELKSILLRCVPASYIELAVLFVIDPLSTWPIPFSENDSKNTRVESILSSLLNQYDTKDRNALVSFLRILSDNTNAQDKCHLELEDLANRLAERRENPGRQREIHTGMPSSDAREILRNLSQLADNITIIGNHNIIGDSNQTTGDKSSPLDPDLNSRKDLFLQLLQDIIDICQWAPEKLVREVVV